MANNIKCPNCGNEFDVENVLAADIELKYRQEYKDKLNQSLLKVEADKNKLATELHLFEEKKRKENEIFANKLQQEKLRMETEIQEQLTKSIAADFENKLRVMHNTNTDIEEKLKEARKKELEFLQKEQLLINKEADLEITLQRKLQQERNSIGEQIRLQENEKNLLKETSYLLKLKELELQLNEQKKLADEMKRKAEQSSMQRQGEVQELLLESILKENFPFDLIEEVGKGKGRAYGVAVDGKVYYGRGYVQLTWLANYKTMTNLLGVNLIKNPALACEPDIAAQVMMQGMARGLFTGKKLSDYISSLKCDYLNARRIINGTDKALLIAGHARVWEAALNLL